MTRLIFSLCALAGLAFGSTQVSPEKALQLLAKQNKQLEQQIIKIDDHIYTAVGYHGANTTMIVGDDGVIIIDTLFGPASASNAWTALQKLADNKPVKAIIYTHSHGDHIGGAAAFTGDSSPEIYATHNFGSAEGRTEAAEPIKRIRNVRQFGRKLPKAEQTNRGVARAGTIDHDRGEGFIEPTIRLDAQATRLKIAGIEIELHQAPGETDDALFVWLPKERVLLTGDNFYSAFPNLYAIRGTAYRDVLVWSNSVKKMASFKPEHIIPGHTIPISENATQALVDYSSAIRSVYDQTVRGINQGKSPNLIAQEVKLPKELAEKAYLTEFYGTVPHAVRAIYAGLLGWFDGNPTTLNPLSPHIHAQQVAKLAGGSVALEQKMTAALQAGEYQWALELCDELRWLDNVELETIRKAKITALRKLGEREFNAPNRNYYLSYANELEAGELDALWH